MKIKIILNTRKHNIINIVNKIVKEHDIIISEKLEVKEMVNNSKLAKNILDASFNKIYSKCGEKTVLIQDLNMRKWKCMKCEMKHDRDINASINIMY